MQIPDSIYKEPSGNARNGFFRPFLEICGIVEIGGQIMSLVMTKAILCVPK